MCDEDLVTRTKVNNCLQRIGSDTITFENAPSLRKQELLFQRQVKYVEDIIITRDTANLGISRQEVIHMISDIGQASSYVQAENQLDYFIREKRLPNLKRHGRVIKSQATIKERSRICVSQQ